MKIKKKSNAVRVPPVKKPIKIKRKASDVEEESTVTKALENVKKVLKKKNVESVSVVSKPKKSDTLEVTEEKKIHRRPRGIVYLGHIPHGFYEEQMEEYFKQFGRVTRVRVSRSKKTGKSRGYGYIEFIHPDVAKIAAETMNNYLMCGRLLKATYIPPSKQHQRYFAGRTWTNQVYPRFINRKNCTRHRNAILSDEEHKNFVQSTMHKLTALEKKLKEKGFDLKFTPVKTPKT